MSAYIVVEGIVRDKESLGRYASQAIPLIKEFGGEVLAFGPWELLFGEDAYHNGMIIRFADRDTALAWCNSAAYQAPRRVSRYETRPALAASVSLLESFGWIG
jgi:uncharacterized protein (DUF1330 family)